MNFMESKLLIITAILFLCLTGCADSKTVSTADSTSEISFSADVALGNSKMSDDITAESETEDISAAEPAQAEEKKTEASTAESKSVKSADEIHPPNPEEPPKSEISKPNVSEETKSSEPPIVSEQPKEPDLTEPKAPDLPKSSAPTFNIDYWVGYAEDYAQSIGLKIDSSAADCWDAPISANSGSAYLERDIKNRLDRYLRDGSVSQVLIWAKPDGESSYLLYIGYS